MTREKKLNIDMMRWVVALGLSIGKCKDSFFNNPEQCIFARNKFISA